MCTCNNSLTADKDFEPLSVELVFTSDSNLTQCVSVSVVDDELVEWAESFQVTMMTDHPLVTIPTSLATINIADNDGMYVCMYVHCMYFKISLVLLLQL